MEIKTPAPILMIFSTYIPNFPRKVLVQPKPQTQIRYKPKLQTQIRNRSKPEPNLSPNPNITQAQTLSQIQTHAKIQLNLNLKPAPNPSPNPTLPALLLTSASGPLSVFSCLGPILHVLESLCSVWSDLHKRGGKSTVEGVAPLNPIDHPLWHLLTPTDPCWPP